MLRTVPLVVAALGAAVSGAAQGPLAAGYRLDVVLRESVPTALGGFAPGLADDFYVAAADEVVHVDAAGRRTVLHRFPAGGRAGLLARPPGKSELWFTENGTTRCWRRDLRTGATVQGSIPRWAFDLALAPGGTVLVTANPGWPAPNARSGVWLVDVTGGAHREIVRLSGPSGPLAFDADGNLLYAVQSPSYPTPKGSVRILRFAAAAVQGAITRGTQLTEADAETSLGGLDGAFDLVHDDRGRLYWSDPQRGTVLRTRPGALVPDPVPLLAAPPPPSTTVALGLAFADRGPATFDPYQPGTGAALYVHLTDWQRQGEVARVRAVRPVALSSPTQVAPPGPLLLVGRGLPPSGPAWLWATTAKPVPERPLLTLLGAPLWSGMALSPPPVSVAGIADAQGRLQLPTRHPGGFGAVVHLQVFGLHAPAAPPAFGTSSVYSLTLLP